MQLWTDADLDMVPFRETANDAEPPRDWPERTERMDISGGEYVVLQRFPNGAVGLTHEVRGAGRDFTLFTPDESAALAAFILRTQRPGAGRLSEYTRPLPAPRCYRGSTRCDYRGDGDHECGMGHTDGAA